MNLHDPIGSQGPQPCASTNSATSAGGPTLQSTGCRACGAARVKSRPAHADDGTVRVVLGLLVSAVFAALFLGVGGDAVRGHVTLLIGAVGGLAVAGRGLLGSA